MEQNTQDVAECLEAWSDSLIGARQSEEERKAKIRTVQRFADQLAWASVKDITKGEVMRARDSMGALSTKTVNLNLSRLRTFLAWCVDTGRLDHNPADGVKPPKIVKGQGQRAFTDIELDALITVTPHPRKALWQFAANTGLRWGECRDLRWKNVVLGDNPHLILGGDMTKNSKDAVLPLTLAAMEALGSLHTDAAQPGDRVFTMPDKLTIKSDMRRAQIPERDANGRAASFHSFRKYFATMLAKGGVDVYVAKELMRHANISTTERSYIDAKQLQMRRQLDKAFPQASAVKKRTRTNDSRLTDPTGNADDTSAPGGPSGRIGAGVKDLNDPTGIRTPYGQPLTPTDLTTPPDAIARAVALLAAWIEQALRRYRNEDEVSGDAGPMDGPA